MLPYGAKCERVEQKMTEVLTAAQMRAIETEAMACGAVTGLELMERAGAGVVAAVLEAWPQMGGGRGLGLCGGLGRVRWSGLPIWIGRTFGQARWWWMRCSASVLRVTSGRASGGCWRWPRLRPASLWRWIFCRGFARSLGGGVRRAAIWNGPPI